MATPRAWPGRHNGLEKDCRILSDVRIQAFCIAQAMCMPESVSGSVPEPYHQGQPIFEPASVQQLQYCWPLMPIFLSWRGHACTTVLITTPPVAALLPSEGFSTARALPLLCEKLRQVEGLPSHPIPAYSRYLHLPSLPAALLQHDGTMMCKMQKGSAVTEHVLVQICCVAVLRSIFLKY